jgi:hypothetical protein
MRDLLASAFVYGGAAAMTVFVPALGLLVYGNLKDDDRAIETSKYMFLFSFFVPAVAFFGWMMTGSK